MTKEEIARKIVEYFHATQLTGRKWDSIMYVQKDVVIKLLNQLNQNKDEQKEK